MPRWDRAISVDRRKIAVGRMHRCAKPPNHFPLGSQGYVPCIAVQNYLILFFQFDFNEIHTTASTFIRCINASALAAFLSVTTFGPHHLWTEWGPRRALAPISLTRAGKSCLQDQDKELGGKAGHYIALFTGCSCCCAAVLRGFIYIKT